MDARDIQARLETAFPRGEILVEGEGDRFGLRIVDAAFEGLNRVRRQQAVYAALGDAITGGAVHAVSMQTFTPDEFAAAAASGGAGAGRPV